jgi:hypothetical protein
MLQLLYMNTKTCMDTANRQASSYGSHTCFSSVYEHQNMFGQRIDKLAHTAAKHASFKTCMLENCIADNVADILKQRQLNMSELRRVNTSE